MKYKNIIIVLLIVLIPTFIFVGVKNHTKRVAINKFNNMVKVDPTKKPERNKNKNKMSIKTKAPSTYDSGVIKMNKKVYKGAIADFDKVIKENPKNTMYYYMRATAKRESGDKQGAIDDLNKALQLDPKNVMVKSLKKTIESK